MEFTSGIEMKYWVGDVGNHCRYMLLFVSISISIIFSPGKKKKKKSYPEVFSFINHAAMLTANLHETQTANVADVKCHHLKNVWLWTKVLRLEFWPSDASKTRLEPDVDKTKIRTLPTCKGFIKWALLISRIQFKSTRCACNQSGT